MKKAKKEDAKRELKEVFSEDKTEKIDFRAMENRWMAQWEKSKIFEVKEDPKKKKFYCLDMFPYPSGEGLHIGHAFVYSLGDIFARFKRMNGFNVLYPIGYDALGLPAENAAIKKGVHPMDYTKKSISNFMMQQKAMGWSYDWSRMINTSDPAYYRWDQWIFLKMLEKGIAFRKKAPVNWCPKCQSVLANEQVVDGKCWRHEDCSVEIKHLEQWFFKITDYAEELLKGLDKLDWPERAKVLQKNWIGKSEGTKVIFQLEKSEKKIEVFTTRPDTLFGVMFLVAAVQSPLVEELVKGTKYEKEYKKFLKKATISEKLEADKEKEGFFTGKYAIHPLSGGQIPIYASNFVLADYGTGVVMAVPAHDQRDFEFARKYDIPIKLVIQPDDRKLDVVKMKEAYGGLGILVNSGAFNDLNSEEAKEHITNALKENGLGGFTTEYKLRDWLVSRQRYWGTPIPVIYCDKCGIVPVPEKDLPVELPKDVEFGKGNPLMTNKDFVNVKCPKCNGAGRRETDTMDTFVNSSWYFLRYTDPHNSKAIFDKGKAAYWTPIDQYIGGPEHITMHLIYMRFVTKFLRDMGMIKIDEPANRYFTQGIVHGPDGEKMSKSRGNIIEPLAIIDKYGADTLRMALVSFASPDKDSIWDEKIVIGSHKFLTKVHSYFKDFKPGKADAKTESKINASIKTITELVENFRHNLAIIELRELFSHMQENAVGKGDAEKFLKMLHVYCPYLTEELWHNLGNKTFISLGEWPRVDEKKIDEKFEQEDRALEQIISDIQNILRIIKEKSGRDGDRIYLYAIPKELNIYDAEKLSRRLVKEVKVFAVNDKGKYDPQGKAGKAKPGKPAIYVE